MFVRAIKNLGLTNDHVTSWKTCRILSANIKNLNLAFYLNEKQKSKIRILYPQHLLE